MLVGMQTTTALWRTVWRFLKKLEIELPYDPSIPLLGIHTEETRIERDTCTPMFITALFIIARKWKQPRCPSADEWIRKLWYIYTMEYYSAIKNNTFESVLIRWMNWCFWTVVLEKTLESPLNCKEIQPVHSKGDQSWVFFGKNDAKAETPVLWPPHAKNWLIGKDPDAGRGWGQEEKGMTEDEMAGWHHRLNGREFEWTLEVGDGQGGLVYCNSWGRKESHTTERLNWTELNLLKKKYFQEKEIDRGIIKVQDAK